MLPMKLLQPTGAQSSSENYLTVALSKDLSFDVVSDKIYQLLGNGVVDFRALAITIASLKAIPSIKPGTRVTFPYRMQMLQAQFRF